MSDYEELYTKKEAPMGKSLEPGSEFNHLDTDGDGVISDVEMARAKDLAEFEHKRRMQDNEDKKEDQIRAMAWFALWGMLVYPFTIIITSIVGYDKASSLVADIAPTYFVAIAGLVAAFFGAQAYSKANSSS
jgi:hypothetical protein